MKRHRTPGGAASTHIARQIVDAVREDDDATSYNLIERALAADARAIMWSLAKLAAGPMAAEPPDDDVLTVVGDATYEVEFYRDQRQDFSVALDRVELGKPLDNPEIFDVSGVSDLGDVLRRIGVPADRVVSEATRLWHEATTTVMVRLIGEGVECWRPVTGRVVRHAVYELLGPTPQDETWEFPEGSIVRCDFRRLPFDGEVILAAIETA